MRSVTSGASGARRPSSSVLKARLERWAPWLAAVVLVAGIAAFAATRLTGGSSAAPPHRRAPIEAAERRVALDFIATAVARRNLGRAWDLVTPELKQGMTLEQWKSGTIPVVPYPVAQARMLVRPVSSFTDAGTLSVTFLPRSGTTARAARFTLDLRKDGGRWLVSGWRPTSTVTPPSGK
jgi:hypothetical protein